MIDVNEICQTFIKYQVDAEGVYPCPGARVDRDGEVALYALGLQPKEVVDLAFKSCRDEAIAEFFVSIDCYAKPDQGVGTDSLLCVFYVRKGEPARLGVVGYSYNDGRPVIEDLVWDHPFWVEHYQTLLLRLTMASQGVRVRQPVVVQ